MLCLFGEDVEDVRDYVVDLTAYELRPKAELRPPVVAQGNRRTDP